jgi:hypothetical protein
MWTAREKVFGSASTATGVSARVRSPPPNLAAVSPAADIGKKGTNLANDIKRRSDMSVVAWDVARLAGYLTGRPELNIVHTLLSFIAKSNHEKNPYK